mmetsp:Transcript_30016/g.90226  ORF Transcript_30016/g.90226 Transcript_30016/m.90226 type:complete len:366 (-) Transcript_30016:49-1146(-)
MNFSTKKKGAKRVGSWRDAAASDAPAAKSAKRDEREAGEDADDDEDDGADAFARLKRDLAERERIKAQRAKQLAKDEAVVARTRGEAETAPGVHVWLDVEIPKRSTHDAGAGRLIFELFEDICPRTCKNFAALFPGGKPNRYGALKVRGVLPNISAKFWRISSPWRNVGAFRVTSGRSPAQALITGEKGDGLHFKGTVFHKVEPGKAISGGDIDKGDGTGGRSVYGRDFEDENHRLKHTNAGVLSMLSRRPNANNSQFQVLLDERPDLDGRQVVFGRLVDGYAILREIEKLGTVTGAPKELAVVSDCGVCDSAETSDAIVQKYRGDLVVPNEVTDMKTMAKNYRNKTNYYDNSTRSALFSWTTSC